MHVRVLFFGMLKDLVGKAAEEVDCPPGTDLRAIFDGYAARYPRLRELASSIVMARNQEFADLSASIAEGDEVAFLPPVSGGSEADCELSQAGHFFALTRHAIDTRAVIARLLNGTEGAAITFEGTVRNHTKGRATRYLDYECYEQMALKTMLKVGLEVAEEYQIERVALIHRLGRLLIGETSVAVIVTAAHRGPAFEAARAAIDRLKKRVPIWKKEHFVDGEVWVEGEWDRNVPVAG
ncbi:MAG TPA: molybdenum cofactor biosynthesis protein MoaE [Bryobacteraceae bacterium]|jgi:molybdopterin synthase catalytic subunit|nr:molybdenum cofactor biosynthesis protein MoaE [Bryobacteraceae bacterium]